MSLRPLPLLVLALACVGVVLTARAPDLHPRRSELRPVLLRPAFARTLSRPFLPMLVDVLWLRALNAIGLPDTAQKNVTLYEYGLVLSELDPRFRQVYEFIGLAIPYAVGRDRWLGAEEASDMFRRGLAVFPTSRKLHLYLGFNLMFRERKFLDAADVFARAAKLPDALSFMAPLAARLKAHGGAPEEGIALTQELLASTTDEQVRKVLERRLEELAVEVVLSRVDRAIGSYRERTGKDPVSLDELRASGVYTGPAEDPFGMPITIESGKAMSASLNRRLEIYE